MENSFAGAAQDQCVLSLLSMPSKWRSNQLKFEHPFRGNLTRL